MYVYDVNIAFVRSGGVWMSLVRALKKSEYDAVMMVRDVIQDIQNNGPMLQKAKRRLLRVGVRMATIDGIRLELAGREFWEFMVNTSPSTLKAFNRKMKGRLKVLMNRRIVS